MTSRSRFYVDTPRDPSQRHSMFVSHSELAQGVDQSSNSSSATLPSAAGSVDRLTGLEEKKSSRFFTLKPKSSFSLKPFFRSSSSLISLSPGKRRKDKKILERRDSGVQTDESRPEFEEIGVQTLNASTVDVPVQTSLGAWEEGDSYGQRRLAYSPASRASPFWSRPYAPSSGPPNSLTVRNVPKDPLAPPKLVKYSAPGDFTTKTAASSPSAVSPPGVNTCQPVSPPLPSPDSTNVPVKYFPAKELAGKAVVSLPVDLQSQTEEKNTTATSSNETYDNLCSPVSKSDISAKDNDDNLCKGESSLLPKELPLDYASETVTDSTLKSEASLPKAHSSPDTVSSDFKYSELQNIEHPAVSVLKTERTDSPSKRLKSVHFDLPSPEPQTAVIHNPCKSRNVDKDFEDLLKELNVWTDEDSYSQVSFDTSPHNQCPTSSLLSPNLKSAIDILKQDFLAPIPETSNECTEDELNNESETSEPPNLNKDSATIADSEVINSNVESETNLEIVGAESRILEIKPCLARSISEYDNQVFPETNKIDSVTQTSKPVFKKSHILETKPFFTRSISEYDNQISPEANNIDSVTQTSKPIFKKCHILETKPFFTRSISEYDNQVSLEVNKNDSVTQTPEPLFTSANSGTNVETDSREGNVYDNVIKEENPVQTVPLPTLPSFFEPPSHPRLLETTEIVEFVGENSFDHPSCSESKMPFDMDFDRSRISRSSSRSSIRSNSKTGLEEASQETVNRFDSCENLDQLEEEIIRSLYSPDEGKLEDTIMNNIELPPSESFQNSGTTATHMRRVILDQLLSGKTVEDIVPNYSKCAKPVSETVSKYKPAKKYTAVLTKFENDSCANYPTKDSTNGNILRSAGNVPNVDLLDQKKKGNISSTKYTPTEKIESPKKTSVFLFPSNDITNSTVPEKNTLEIFANSPQNRSQPLLEVRRSSWTPQTRVDSPAGITSVENPCSGTEHLPDTKSERCDFTNCLKPSKLQNSPFLSKINTRSMSPCRFSPLPPIQSSSISNASPTRNQCSPVKAPEAVGECDFGSCLKPSQVQNSLFTNELSEITAGKSTNSLRAGSPLTVRMNSPLPVRSGSVDRPSPSPLAVESKSIHDDTSEPVNHKSELSITLLPTIEHSKIVESYPETMHNPANSFEVASSEKRIINPADIALNPETPESAAIPPPPPPPPSSQNSKPQQVNGSSMESMIREQKSNLNFVESPSDSRFAMPPKTPIISELEIKLQIQNKRGSPVSDSEDKTADSNSAPSTIPAEISNAGKYENVNGSPPNLNGNQLQNGNIGILSNQRDHSVPASNDKNDGHLHGPKLTFSTNRVITTDEPPPPGAVLLDKKVTVDGDQVHTDKYYAIPMKEVLREKTSTTKFIPAPPKYEGIGPTEDGVPIGLRNSVKKENMHNWYKTMFKSLHKADSSNDSQEYIIGYTSEPETSKKDMKVRKKSSTLDSRLKHDVNSNYMQKQKYPSAKSSIEVYNVRPRMIEDYEPGYSSVTDDEIVTSRRYLPALNTPKPSYEFKNGYESDTTMTRKRDQPEALSSDQQKMWYREIQKGADIPQFGLGKVAPEKPKEPVIGPLPPPPLNYTGPSSQQQGVRPLALPADYTNQNGNGYCQQNNGAYEMHIRNAIHSEMQQRRSPCSNQLSPPIRTTGKSPSGSPDLKIPAQALFDFRAESPKEMSLKKGEMVLIQRQLDKNWYEGEHRGVVGLFPISYVEIVPPEHASTPIKQKPEGLGRALYDFVAHTSVELTVRKGETITLIRRVDSNWFEAILNSKKGIVPISYIQILQEPMERSSPPRSCPISPSSESREKLQKVNSLSPSAYSSSSTSPLPVSPTIRTPVFQERRKLISKKSSNLIEPVMYRALYSYSPQNTDELELEEGDSVCVVEMCDDGWYVGTSVRTGVFGIFPGNYVEKTS